MKARLNTLMGQTQQELNSFGDAAIYGDANQASRLLHAFYALYRHLITTLDPTARRFNFTPHDSVC